jgi:hypothetical protein
MMELSLLVADFTLDDCAILLAKLGILGEEKCLLIK